MLQPFSQNSRHVRAIPCGLQGGGALGDASTPGTPAGSIAASARGGTYSHVAVAGGAWGRERGTAAATARRLPAGVARRPRKEPSLHRAAHLRTADGAVDTAHGRTGGTDRARRGASNRAARWRQKPPTSRRNRSRRAGTITRGSSWARRTPKSLRAVSGRNSGGAGGQGPSGPCDPCGRTVLLSRVTLFAFSVILTLATLTRPQIPEDTNAGCHL